MTVWAVVYGNYEPPEVLALYDNEPAARIHAADQRPGDDGLPYEVVTMPVLSKHQPRSDGGVVTGRGLPEDFPTGGRIGFREHLLAPTDDGFICRRCGRFSRDEHSDETCLGEEEGGGS